MAEKVAQYVTVHSVERRTKEGTERLLANTRFTPESQKQADELLALGAIRPYESNDPELAESEKPKAKSSSSKSSSSKSTKSSGGKASSSSTTKSTGAAPKSDDKTDNKSDDNSGDDNSGDDDADKVLG